MLAIEAYGTYHDEEETFSKDSLRQNRLESFEITVVRV